MSGNNKLLILIFIIPILIFAGILFFSKNKTPIPYPNALHQGQNQAQNQANSSNNYNFTANEVPAFNFPSVAYASDLQKNVSIYNSNGQKMGARINTAASGNGSSIQINKTQQFTPGKYSLVVNQDGKKIEQDFTWGVLAINPNKSVYSIGETAKLALAVLDEKGAMVCDANVTLEIKDPLGQTTTLSTQNGTIIVNPECKQKKYTVNPDYETKYQVKSLGTYQMSLTAVTKKGTYNIIDSFAADNNAEFDIERATATRIYPYSAYPVVIKIIAKNDFSGQIKEAVPASFTISMLENVTPYSDIQKNNDSQYILWNISIKKGETINIGYNYKAPLISPQFYLLGPLRLVSGDTAVFEEKRAWQLAIDGIYSSTILGTSGLVGYWRLGEPSGTNAADSSTTNNGGTYSGSGYTLGTTGLLSGDSNTALGTGTSGYVSVPHLAAQSLISNFSVELWVHTPTSNTTYVLYTKGTSVDFPVLYVSLGTLVVDSNSGGGEEHRGGTLASNTTYHIVYTRGSTANSTIVYVNGINITSHPGVGEIAYINNTSALTWGSEAGGSTLGAGGILDETALYNVILTPAQVKAHYQLGQALFNNYSITVLNDNPTAYWRLGESAGVTAVDEIGLYPGTYTGTYTLGQTGALTGDSNTSVTFGGTGYVDVPFAAAVYDTVSIEAWVKWVSGSGFILSRGTNLYAVQMNTNGTVKFTKSNVSDISTSTVALTSGVWAHVVVTKAGASSHIYINGSDVTGTVTNATLTANWDQLGVGADRGGTAILNGSLDEVALYNYALSPAQVLAHYNAGITAPGSFRFQGLKMQGIKIN